MSALRRPDAPPTFAACLTSWLRALRAQQVSPHTLKSYGRAVTQLADHCEECGLSDSPVTQDAGSLRDFLSHIAETRSPATAQTRFDALKSFYRWLEEEEELDGDSPMAKVKRPLAPEPQTDVLEVDELRALLATCDRSSFVGCRDSAILRVFIDTGVRVGGLVSMTADEDGVDLENGFIAVRLKGGRRRRLPVGVKAAQELDRYLRRRGRHPFADDPALWLGLRGRFTESGVGQMVAARGRQAGIRVRVFPHMLRHTWAHQWQESGGQDSDLIELAGWTSGKQLGRYGRIRREQRATEAHRRLSPGDRV